MKPRKRFGQHFLTDPYLLQRFALAIGPKTNDHLVEIGPGQGALTDYLVGTSKKFDLIEIDRNLIPLLKNKYSTQATLHEADALSFDFGSLVTDKKLRLFGNLPYNISTPLLFHLFSNIDIILDMHFLLQKEVVDRLIAQPGQRNYGRLSVMSQFFCDAESVITVPPEAFDPPPRVMSAFVRLHPRANTLTVKSHQQLQAIVREAFNYRRKTLSNSLKQWITAEQLTQLGINPTRRPQELSVEDYIQISNSIEK
jgi:16S rRNA (adenine1518-N6/adenine1519-N6)-dimethyltransferase